MFDLSHIRGNRVQMHVLKSHGPSNLNRDDMGRPKEAMIGGVRRLRISSQSLKRSIRTGETFAALRAYMAQAYGSLPMVRTTRLESIVCERLEAAGLSREMAIHGAKAASALLRKSVDEDEAPGPPKSSGKSFEGVGTLEPVPTQLVTVSEAEIDELVRILMSVEDKSHSRWAARAFKADGLRASRLMRLRRGDLSPEISLFGRMSTNDFYSGVASSLQVAHSFTVHEATIERDYWIGVDDINVRDDIRGAGMMDVRRFGAGVFYSYSCIDVALLRSNLRASHVDLQEDQVDDLTRDIISAYAIAFAGTNPTGYQNSFASHAMPVAVLMEVGGGFPHSAAAAFESPVLPSQVEKGYIGPSLEAMNRWQSLRVQHFGQRGKLFQLGLSNLFGESRGLEDVVHAASRQAIANLSQ